MNLTVYNGSPRGNRSNTKILLEHFLQGFSSVPGNSHQVHMLFKRKQLPDFVKAFSESQNVIVAMPLYVHAMPGIVKHFIEALKPHDPAAGTSMGFIVQSGFPAAHHSRHLEAYLKRLPGRLRSRYVGTVIKGGVEGIQIKPPFLTNKLYKQFRKLGEHFGRHGEFDPELVEELSKPEWLSRGRQRFYRILKAVKIADLYWNKDLKKNKVFDRRFDRPYSP
jgi:hypothetical protein